MAKDKFKKIISSLEGLKVALKKLIQEALINGTSREDLEKQGTKLIDDFVEEHKELKVSYPKLYDMFDRLLKGNFLTMYKISTSTFNKELLNDKISKAIQLDLKRAYKSDKIKKESYVFLSGDNIEVSKIDASDAPNLKYIRTNAEFGYTQMQIDNYVEKVERVMDKVSQINFLAVNSRGARISLRNKAEMEVRYQDMLEDLKGLKDEKFVIVSQHKDSSLRCACWQGLIYLKDTDGTDVTLKDWHEWNNTKNHIVPKPIGYTKDNQPYYSLRDAMEHGLFSYNCRHRFIKYTPGVKVPKQLPYNPNEESKHSQVDQKMRQMEQNIRRAKERQTLALTPKERKKWQARSKKLQADYSAFCKANNRVRNEWRTSIGVVERGPMKATEVQLKEPYIDPTSTPNEKEAIIKKVPAIVKVTAKYKSAEYKAKVDSLPFSRIQIKAIYKGIRRIFNNQKSEYSEGFYAIDLNNPKVKFYNGNGEADSVRRPLTQMKSYLTKAQNPDLLTIHNHRGDSYPSIDDLKVNMKPYSNKLLVIGNKGSIYYCDLSKSVKEMVDVAKSSYKLYNPSKEEFKDFCIKANIKFKILQEVNDDSTRKK